MLEAGGTISSAQGCGLARTQFLRKQYGELVQVFREIKDAFDPLDQLNPGKVIGDDPHLMLRNLKPWLRGPGPVRSPSTPSWHGRRSSSRGAAASSPPRRERQATREPCGNSRVPRPSTPMPADAPVIEPALRWPRLDA